MMVPVFHDVASGKTKVWAILGWSTRTLDIDFTERPRAHILEGNVRIKYHSTSRTIAYPVFAEAYVSRLLDRDEFRAHCDRYKTEERILAHLGPTVHFS